MIVFFKAGSWEKDKNFEAAGKFFGPSYFVMALHGIPLSYKHCLLLESEGKTYVQIQIARAQ